MNRVIDGIKALYGVIGYSQLPREKRQITFYSEGKNYWPHLQGLLKATLEKTKKSVCYVSSSENDPGIMYEHPNLKTFFIGMNLVRNYFFQNLDTDIMITTMPDLNKYQIKRSSFKVHYIYVQHSLVSLHTIYRHGAFDHYDTICAAGPHHVKEIRAIEEKYSLPVKNIIKLGYSRLDNLIKASKKNFKYNIEKNQIHKKFLIAPSWGKEGIIESGLCKTLVKKLLDIGHDVILRPHHQTLKFDKNKVEEIILNNKNNPHFVFEENLNSQDSLFDSDIMISDWSGVALEYYFAFNKPIIFCDVPKKINNPNYKDIQIKPIEEFIRKKIGVIWDGLSPIEEIIKISISSKKEDFYRLREKHCYNVENSDYIFAKSLDYLI